MSYPTLAPLLERFIELQGSDLYLTVGCAPSVRVSDRIIALSGVALSDADIERIIGELLDEEKREEFASTMELNMPLPWDASARFRINMFRQQQHSGLVIRSIQTKIPMLESLKMPKIYSDLIMENRGLLLVVGPTGSGKSTSLAAMIGHRNRHGFGHILTIEDPIEFVHRHDNCIITQRDVGVDTYSLGMALKNVLRQRPDVVLIGEIRDHETMEQALHFSETGHLCVSTLHASNVHQALERIINFFPEENHAQVRYNLAHNLRGILSQRLVMTTHGTRIAAVEAMVNRGHIRNLIQENKLKDIADIMFRNRSEGMQTFDQALYQLYTDNVITEEVAVGESDNPASLRILIHQHQNTKLSGAISESSLKLQTPSSFRTLSSGRAILPPASLENTGVVMPHLTLLRRTRLRLRRLDCGISHYA